MEGTEYDMRFTVVGSSMTCGIEAVFGPGVPESEKFAIRDASISGGLQGISSFDNGEEDNGEGDDSAWFDEISIEEVVLTPTATDCPTKSTSTPTTTASTIAGTTADSPPTGDKRTKTETSLAMRVTH